MRKTKTVVIGPDGGRDAGKVFLLTEMPARQAERWAQHALLLVASSGADVGNVRGGMAGVAVMGIQALMGGAVKFAEVEPLLDEMMRCVQIVPDPRNTSVIRPLNDRGVEGDDIEEVMTRVKLRAEVLDLHLGFSLADALSTLAASASQPTDLPTTLTSPTPSAS